MNYYCLSKVLWNPDTDVDAIIEDFYRSGFGQAAPRIRAYFDALEKMTDRVAGTRRFHWYAADYAANAGPMERERGRRQALSRLRVAPVAKPGNIDIISLFAGRNLISARPKMSARKVAIVGRKKTERNALAPVGSTAALWALVAFAATAASPAAGADNLVLVRDGVPASTIVIADRPSSSAETAAEAFREYIRKMSGATLGLVREAELTSAEQEQTLVLIGGSDLAAQLGLRSDRIGIEGLRIKTFDKRLVLIGNERRKDAPRMMLRGTEWAVHQFLEKYLHVRWLWPGELGTVIPRRPTISVGAIDESFVPQIRSRGVWMGPVHWEGLQKRLDEMGMGSVGEEPFKAKKALRYPWWEGHKIGESMDVRCGHAFREYWDHYGKTYPEWFALQTRDGKTGRGVAQTRRLCKSNPELIAHIVKTLCETVEFHKTSGPVVEVWPIGPNDGSSDFCACDPCKAWDALEDRGYAGRVTMFYNRIAEGVTRKYPDQLLGGLAFVGYAQPPEKLKLHPNVVIALVPGISYLNDARREQGLQIWDHWSQVHDRLFVNANLLLSAWGFPVIFVHKMTEDFKYFMEGGLFKADYDSVNHHWATKGLNYYALAKLMWDPDADPNAIIEDYCRSGWGSAAPRIRAYFDALEKMTDRVARTRQFHWNRVRPLLNAYSDDFLGKLRGILDEARQLAGDDPVIRRRIDFLEIGVRYTEVQRDALLAIGAARKGGEAERKKRDEAVAVRSRFYTKIGATWAVNLPYVHHDFVMDRD